MKYRTKAALLVILTVIPFGPAGAGPVRFGAMGDSLTDEYWDNGSSAVSTYATNWPQLLVLFRGFDMGPTAAQAGTNSWGEPRNTGYKYNWARSGATSASLLSQGQHTGLRAQAASDGVAYAVLAIGPNDFNPSTSAYINIYYGLWSSSQIQNYVNQSVSNIETALSTVKAAGISLVLANVIDPGPTPAASSTFTSGPNRERVAAAVRSVNTGVKNLAQKYQVPLMDWYALETAVLGPNTNLHSTLKIGNVTINLRGWDPGPPNSAPTNAFVSDKFHPNTVFQGVFANTVLQAFDAAYGAGIPLLTEQEILNHALIAYGGSDTLQSQIGPWSDYITLPILPRITGINVGVTNVALAFSTVSNQLYIVESRDSLLPGPWTTVSNNFPGTGGISTVTNRVPADLRQRFYRVRQLP